MKETVIAIKKAAGYRLLYSVTSSLFNDVMIIAGLLSGAASPVIIVQSHASLNVENINIETNCFTAN